MSATPKCTCKTKNPSTTTKFHQTKVDKEGICIYCGHYAVWDSSYELFPKSYFGIHGYKQVSCNHTSDWSPSQIETYFSNIDYDHDNYEIYSGRINMDYSGIGKGSRKSRRKEKGVINKAFNRRTHL